jgi:Arc/MetJ-type ribon-helix-helix transcriptional regulator
MQAHSKLTESDNVSFYSQSTSEVVQRALRESSKDSNEGDKENDALTKALKTKEQRGRVHGVSSKLTKKEGFLEHKSTYRKRKITSTPWVDMEKLKR